MTRRLVIVVSHPIQYQAPLYCWLTNSGRIDVEVLFLSEHGIEPSFDSGYGRPIQYDVPLTDGYAHRFVTNRSLSTKHGAFGWLVNPGLVRELSPRRYDAVLIHGYAHLSEWLAYATSCSRQLPYFVRGESLEPDPAVRRTFRREAKNTVLRPLLHGAAGVLAIGLRNARFYAALGVPEAKIHWAPYSIDNDAFEAGGREGRACRRELLQGLRLDPALPVVLFAAKLQRRKRARDVIDAIDKLHRPVSLIVIGDGEQRAMVDAKAQSRPWMRVLGFVNQQEIRRWYGVADVYVLPSDYETWGLGVNEAMAAGAVPIVSDAVGCAPDLVEGGSGRVFRLGDVSSLAGAIEDVLSAGSLRAARDEVARRIGRYAIDATGRGIEQAVLAL